MRHRSLLPLYAVLAFLLGILTLTPFLSSVDAQGALSRIAGVASSTGKDVPFHVTDQGWPGCDSQVAISGNTIATAALVAPVSGQRVYVCAFLFNGAGATTVKLIRGTGATCGTGTTDITGAMTLASGTVIPLGDSAGAIATTAAGEGVCWSNTAAVQVSGILTYDQY